MSEIEERPVSPVSITERSNTPPITPPRSPRLYRPSYLNIEDPHTPSWMRSRRRRRNMFIYSIVPIACDFSNKNTKPKIINSEKKCENEDCAVCFEKMNDENYVYLNCNHEFCKTCVKIIIDKTNEGVYSTCPLCRSEMKEIYTKTEFHIFDD